MGYILGIDQSTQGTKAILVDETGKILGRTDAGHRQIINDKGWVSHDPEEIWKNVLLVTRKLVEKTGIDKAEIKSIGISNQRETTVMWDKNGKPLAHAIVWQCSRAKDIAEALSDHSDEITAATGLKLSPFFPAAKMAWLLRNTGLPENISREDVYLGTIDSWLIYKMTKGAEFRTDYSNASRTQLFNIHSLCWDEKICDLFGIPLKCLPRVCSSNDLFGMTDLDGYLDKQIPIHGVMGDSHAALFGQGCHKPGMTKTTYGTGSSIMMNTGDKCIDSKCGLVTSLAWGIDGKVDYVLEGNINYTGAVISWLKDDLKLIANPLETSEAALAANSMDHTVVVPAFSGLSAPYWNNNAEAMICGMTRITGRNEIIRAALESIAFQINAVLQSMKQDSGYELKGLRVDGGPTRNSWLMQFQSNISNTTVAVPAVEELSALGAAYMSGIANGQLKKEELFEKYDGCYYHPDMPEADRNEKIRRWDMAIALLNK